ncbi:hypothetical protein JOM56_009080 [Amanita muscaria]
MLGGVHRKGISLEKTENQCINEYVDEIRWEETEPANRDKVRSLKLSGEEWARIKLFLDLLGGDVVKCVEDLFKERYTKLQGETAALHPPTTTVKTKLGILLRELSDDEEDTDVNNTDTRDSALEDPNCPWSLETIPEGWTVIAWWGVSIALFV